MRTTPIQTSAVDDVELALAEQLQAEIVRQQTREDQVQLSTPAGRRFVWLRIRRAHVFDEISGSIEEVYFKLGRRNEGLELLARCQRHPDLFFQMWAEGLKHDKQWNEHVEASRKAARRGKPAQSDAPAK